MPAVVVRVLLAADPEHADVEQPHRAGQHALMVNAVGLQVSREPSSQLRQRLRPNRSILLELLPVAMLAPEGVVEVLLAARRRRSRSPGDGRAGHRRSRRPATQEESPARGGARAPPGRLPAARSRPRYAKPRPRPIRRSPGPEQSDRRRRRRGLVAGHPCRRGLPDCAAGGDAQHNPATGLRSGSAPAQPSPSRRSADRSTRDSSSRLALRTSRFNSRRRRVRRAGGD